MYPYVVAIWQRQAIPCYPSLTPFDICLYLNHYYQILHNRKTKYKLKYNRISDIIQKTVFFYVTCSVMGSWVCMRGTYTMCWHGSWFCNGWIEIECHSWLCHWRPFLKVVSYIPYHLAKDPQTVCSCSLLHPCGIYLPWRLTVILTISARLIELFRLHRRPLFLVCSWALHKMMCLHYR